MKELLIFGNGVHGCEMVEILKRMDVNQEYQLKGFVTDKPDKEELFGYPVYSIHELEDKFRNAWLIPDNTFDLQTKQKYRDRMITLIDPSCFVSTTAKVGPGTVLYPGCFVGFNVILEDFIFCLSGCTINHDDVIGAGSVLTSGVKLAGHVKVGKEAYLGQACTIRQYVEIGEKSMIGTGAVVIADVAPKSVMVGNPARALKR